MAESGTESCVFISYSSQDAAVANAVVAALEGAGVRCWIAPRDVIAGAAYAGQIIRAIDAAKASVLILSGDAAASPHVLREVEHTASTRHPIVALRIDQSPLPADFQYFLNASHWLDASAAGIGPLLPKLIVAVQLALAAPGVSSVRASTSHAASQSISPRPIRKIAMLMASVIGLGLVGFAVERLWWSGRTTARAPTSSPDAQAPKPPTIPEKSIAVLPFADMSEKHDQQYVGDGIAEELIGLLAKVPQLRVIGRTSSFSFKNTSQDIREVGRQLGAAYLVEGTVRRTGNELRVSAQLVDTLDSSSRWSATFNRTSADILTIQDAITTQIAHALHVAVSANALIRNTNVSPQAYDFYLRGMQSLRTTVSPEAASLAAGMFRNAMALAPDFVPAAEGLAEARLTECTNGWGGDRHACETALAAAKAVLDIDPRNSDALAVRAEIQVNYEWDWAGAAASIKRAKEFGGGEMTNYAAARLAHATGDMARATEQYQTIIASSPFDPNAHFDLAYFVYLRSGRYPEAETMLRRLMEISPDFVDVNFALGLALLLQNKPAAALQVMNREVVGEDRHMGLALVYYALGRRAESQSEMNQAYAQQLGDADIARLHAFRHESDQAFQYLEKAYLTRDVGLYYLKGDPLLNNISADPRYQTFLRKMNLPE